jgi:hypothetical protein
MLLALLVNDKLAGQGIFLFGAHYCGLQLFDFGHRIPNAAVPKPKRMKKALRL